MVGLKLNSISTVVLLGCVPLVALAQGGDLCGQLSEFISAAPAKFQSLQGQVDPYDNEFYSATKTIAGASKCEVYHDRDGGLDSYSCNWKSAHNGTLEALYDALNNSVKACLSGVNTRTVSEDSSTGSSRQTVFEVSDSGDWSVEVRVKLRTRSGGSQVVELAVDRDSDN